MKRLIALALSLVADALQIFITPLLAVGVGEGIDAALDVIMCLLLTWLRGFHWVYLPAFVAELIPGIDLVPFWTLAVAITWNAEQKHEQIPPPAEKVVRSAQPTERIEPHS